LCFPIIIPVFPALLLYSPPTIEYVPESALLEIPKTKEPFPAEFNIPATNESGRA